jgi:hypothetical protein
MTTAEWVSICSAAVAVVSAVVAYWSKEQARKAATLAPRREAIDYLRRALEDVAGNTIDRDTLGNILRAKHVGELVFKKDIIDGIDRAHSAASSLRSRPGAAAMTGLRDVLKGLIADMNSEAALP